MSLLSIDEPKTSSATTLAWWQTRHVLWALGFRPFYLLASGFAVLALPLWVVSYLGWLPAKSGNFPHPGLNWHMHEMVFGMVSAVLIGFLYTAVKNWTGLWTPRNAPLAGLAALWLAGRLAMLFAPPLAAALIDSLFLPFAAWPIYRVLRQSGNTRNLFFVGLLSLLSLSDMLFHAATLGWITMLPVTPIQAAILLIVIIESIIGGRVIPMFTSNGAPGTKPIVHAGRDRITLLLTVAASLAWSIGLPASVRATLAIAAAIAILVRVAGWKPHRTLRVPLLWILHISYSWIAVGFIFLALAAFNIISVSSAFHALTVGSMAGLIIGMMTRTTLGHTGRTLRAGRSEIAMYCLIQAGAVTRVYASMGTYSVTALIIASICWSLAFLMYVIRYGTYLTQPRIDGREG